MLDQFYLVARGWTVHNYKDVRLAVGLSLSTTLCKPHLCPYGALEEVSETQIRSRVKKV